MDTHKKAPLTPRGREMVVRAVDGGLPTAAAVCQFNTTPKTVDKWVARLREERVDGLKDRSSRPLLSPIRSRIARRSVTAPYGQAGAAEVGVSAATGEPSPSGLGLPGSRPWSQPSRSAATSQDPGEDPPRYQETRTHRLCGTSLHRAVGR